MPTFYAIQINRELPKNYDEKTPYFVGDCQKIVGIEKAKRFKTYEDACGGIRFWVCSRPSRSKHDPRPVELHC